MKEQKYGIHYPFTFENNGNYFIDLNDSQSNSIMSEILHVILTPKGQRVRMPNFGTDLIKYIYEPNDEQSWDNIKNEISNSVSLFVPNASLKDIRVIENQDQDNKLSLYVEYSVKKGNETENNKVLVDL